MIGIGILAHARGFRMLDLFQGPRSGVESAPRVATGREPRPPVADVFQTARGQQAALKFMAIRSAFRFADDPVRSRQNARCRAPQPRVVPYEAIMLAQHPKNPAVVLVVAARLKAAGTVQHALLTGEIPRER